MLKDYINALLQSGRASFSAEDAMASTGLSRQAFTMAVFRLKKKGELVSPYRNFYLPVLPEYRTLGCLPAEQLLPVLMKHINCDYYVCLLSAAAIYGAAHQRPQITQVIVSKRIRTIHCGNVVIKFIVKKNLSDVPRQEITVRTGYLSVSTPEATLLDLILYPKQSGGLSHIATILTELIDEISPEKLFDLLRSAKNVSAIQRIGFLLGQINPDNVDIRDKALLLLQQLILEYKPNYIPLVHGEIRGYPYDKMWRIIVNTDIESDMSDAVRF